LMEDLSTPSSKQIHMLIFHYWKTLICAHW
jgi:hypothetical protein